MGPSDWGTNDQNDRCPWAQGLLQSQRSEGAARDPRRPFSSGHVLISCLTTAIRQCPWTGFRHAVFGPDTRRKEAHCPLYFSVRSVPFRLFRLCDTILGTSEVSTWTRRQYLLRPALPRPAHDGMVSAVGGVPPTATVGVLPHHMVPKRPQILDSAVLLRVVVFLMTARPRAYTPK